MQQIRLHKKSYHYLSRIDDKEYSEKALVRKKILDDYQKLRADGSSERVILSVLGVSRASYYRWKTRYARYGMIGLEPKSTRPKKVRIPKWSKKLEESVLAVRRKYTLFGKSKIATLLRRDSGTITSCSTVGRILDSLLKRNLVKPASFYTGKYNPKPRAFTNHAKRLPKGMKSQRPGELVQIDHMSVQIDDGKEVKHFEAMCPTTRYSVGQAHRNATSRTAATFLDFVIAQLPFKLISVQVDGGSEFMGDFEVACKERSIPLFVLPPRMPKMNAFVERSNGTVKYEFYKLYEGPNGLDAIDYRLQQYKHFYNTFRPHRGLQERTPMEYYKYLEAQSQML